MIPLWKGKNPIYFGVITIIPFDNLYRRAYFVMHTFLVKSILHSNRRTITGDVIPKPRIIQVVMKNIALKPLNSDLEEKVEGTKRVIRSRKSSE
jgi:hypothetical protein